jgi:hypothetical protein
MVLCQLYVLGCAATTTTRMVTARILRRALYLQFDGDSRKKMVNQKGNIVWEDKKEFGNFQPLTCINRMSATRGINNKFNLFQEERELLSTCEPTDTRAHQIFY